MSKFVKKYTNYMADGAGFKKKKPMQAFYNILTLFRKQFACSMIHICSAPNPVSRFRPSV